MGPEWIQEVNVSRFKRSRVLLNNTFSTWIGSKILCFEINKQTRIDICVYIYTLEMGIGKTDYLC